MVRNWREPWADLALAAGGPGLRDGGPGLRAGVLPHDQGIIRLKHLTRDPSWRDLLAVWEIYRLLLAKRPAILQTHSSKAGFLGRWAAWAAGVPTVVHTAHGHVFYGYFDPLRTRLYTLLERTCVPLTDYFVALSEGERRESLERGIGRPEQWRIAPSGTDLPEDFSQSDKPAARERLGLQGTPLLVGSMLRLEKVKGPDVLLEAAALCRTLPFSSRSAQRGLKAAPLRSGADIRFVLLGEGPLRPRLERRRRELGLEGRFLLPGRKGRIWPWLEAMDVYVQPSRNEGLGRALLQAQACELPVVASDVCGIPDATRAGKSSLLVPPDDPRALAAAILRLAGDPALRTRMGKSGRAWVLAADETGHPRFSPAAMLERHRRLYREILFAGRRDGASQRRICTLGSPQSWGNPTISKKL